MSETPLSRLMPGEHGTIVRIATSANKVRERLMEMGLTKGTPIELIRFAPMGDPIEVKVKGYRLSLRREEAESIFVLKNSA
jgi:ferrous iron transport protein A